MLGIVVDDEERDGGNVSIIGDEARSVPAVFRIFGVPPRPSLGTTVGGVRASEAAHRPAGLDLDSLSAELLAVEETMRPTQASLGCGRRKHGQPRLAPSLVV